MMLRADRSLCRMAIGCYLSVNCGIEQQNIMANQPGCRRTYRNELSEKLGFQNASTVQTEAYLQGVWAGDTMTIRILGRFTRLACDLSQETAQPRSRFRTAKQ